MSKSPKPCRWTLDDEQGWLTSCGWVVAVAYFGTGCPKCHRITVESPAVFLEQGNSND